MRTIGKQRYVAPALGMLEIEMEESIAAISGVTETGTPQIDDYGTGSGSDGWSDDQF
ncbi:hypothetical protein [Sphingobacterium phlebotomi]|uniref:hypothetical protein n=1 Tax=Sphingobacterium phlebotomi TaxID=2605433 RepID=UPI0016536CA7|nr:hypothetical protein [Sphingobacterium phlebotomi]